MLCICRSDKNLQQAAHELEEAVSTAVGSAFNSTAGGGGLLVVFVVSKCFMLESCSEQIEQWHEHSVCLLDAALQAISAWCSTWQSFLRAYALGAMLQVMVSMPRQRTHFYSASYTGSTGFVFSGKGSFRHPLCVRNLTRVVFAVLRVNCYQFMMDRSDLTDRMWS